MMGGDLFDFNAEGRREGYYGPYGGAFIPEILRATIDELTEAFYAARSDPAFWPEFERFMSTYSCRPIRRSSGTTARSPTSTRPPDALGPISVPSTSATTPRASERPGASR